MTTIKKFMINNHEFNLTSKKFTSDRFNYDTVSYSNGLKIPVETWVDYQHLLFEDDNDNIWYFTFEGEDIKKLNDKTFVSLLSEMTTNCADKIVGKNTLFDISKIEDESEWILTIYPNALSKMMKGESFDEFYSRLFYEDYDTLAKDMQEFSFTVEGF